MSSGRIDQIGDPQTVYRTPATRFVEDFNDVSWLWIEYSVHLDEHAWTVTDTDARHAFREGEIIGLDFNSELIHLLKN